MTAARLIYSQDRAVTCRRTRLIIVLLKYPQGYTQPVEPHFNLVAHVNHAAGFQTYQCYVAPRRMECIREFDLLTGENYQKNYRIKFGSNSCGNFRPSERELTAGGSRKHKGKSPTG